MGLLAAISIFRESLARPLPQHLRPAPSSARPAPSRSLPALVLPGAGCGGNCSARSWRSAGAAAGGREPRAGAPSMSRRRRPRAARGRAAARGRRGSDAGADRGRQRQPRAPLGSSGGPSPRVVSAGRAWVRGRAPGRATWSPAWSSWNSAPGWTAGPLCLLHLPRAGRPGRAWWERTGWQAWAPLASPLPRAWRGGGGRGSEELRAAQLEVSICSCAFWV